jgi:RNA:NAD 2'-phosphotransferase (TPT1/KptA family)
MTLTKNEVVKEIVHCLRHDPDLLGLELTEEGEVPFEDLVRGFEETSPHDLSAEYILEAITSCNKGRLEFDPTKGVVRAVQGHTTTQVSYKVAEPPESGFYLAVPPSQLASVRLQGIRSIRRRYTEVFTDYRDAESDAKRRRIKEPFFLFINTEIAYNDGTVFFVHEGRWYVEDVEPSHLEILNEEE